MSGDALSDDLDASQDKGGERGVQNSAEIIHALDDILTTRNPLHKSDIEWPVLWGIIRANTINRQLEERFKSGAFRCTVLDELVLNRMVYVASVQGKGKKDAIRMMEAVKAEIMAHAGIDITDRLLGQGRKV